MNFPAQTEQRQSFRLGHGYLGITLDRLFLKKGAVRTSEVLAEITGARKKPTQRIALNALVNYNPRRYFSPLRGVICRSDRPTDWLDVLSAVDPLYSDLLRRMSPIKGKRVPDLAKEVREPTREVRDALHWLESHGLVFMFGSRDWGLTEKAQAPVPRSTAVEMAVTGYILS